MAKIYFDIILAFSSVTAMLSFIYFYIKNDLKNNK